MSVSMVPQEWKTVIIVPVFKKGQANDMSNYRPISLTCVASKVMERIVVDEILAHFKKSNIISSAQHGLLKGLSLECLNDWTSSLQMKHNITITYVDFMKAFDSVSHEKLLYHLQMYGISGNLLLWIKAFLSNRCH